MIVGIYMIVLNVTLTRPWRNDFYKQHLTPLYN